MYSLYTSAYKKPSITYRLGDSYNIPVADVVRLLAKTRALQLRDNMYSVIFRGVDESTISIEYGTKVILVRVADGLYVLDKLLNTFLVVEQPPTLTTIPLDIQQEIYKLSNNPLLGGVSKYVKNISNKLFNRLTTLPSMKEILTFAFKNARPPTITRNSYTDNRVLLVVKTNTIYFIQFIREHGQRYTIIVEAKAKLGDHGANLLYIDNETKKNILPQLIPYITTTSKFYLSAYYIRDIIAARGPVSNEDKNIIATTIKIYIKDTFLEFIKKPYTPENALPIVALVGKVSRDSAFYYRKPIKDIYTDVYRHIGEEETYHEFLDYYHIKDTVKAST